MIERGEWMVVTPTRAEVPAMPGVANARSIAACGCAVYVGYRTDRNEPASWLFPCAEEHAERVGRVHGRIAETCGGADEELGRMHAIDLADHFMVEEFGTDAFPSSDLPSATSDVGPE